MNRHMWVYAESVKRVNLAAKGQGELEADLHFYS